MIFYFDMDGVLTDFEAELKNRGWSRSDPDFEDKMTKEHIDGEFYLNLPESPWFDDLKKLIHYLDRGHHSVEFLSSLGGRFAGEYRVYDQKKRWLEASGFSMPLKLVRYCSSKCGYASDDIGGASFLIDDQLQNVEEWREAGGVAFHYKNNNQDDLEFIIGSIT